MADPIDLTLFGERDWSDQSTWSTSRSGVRSAEGRRAFSRCNNSYHRFTSLNFSATVSCETITPVERVTVSRQCNSDRPNSHRIPPRTKRKEGAKYVD